MKDAIVNGEAIFVVYLVGAIVVGAIVDDISNSRDKWPELTLLAALVWPVLLLAVFAFAIHRTIVKLWRFFGG